MISLHQLLKSAVKQNASDLHLVPGSAPVLRVAGVVVRIKTQELTSEQVRDLCYSVLTDEQKSQFEERRELDFSFEVKNLARFRGNLFFRNRGEVAGAFRRIPFEIPDVDSLHLPPSAKDIVHFPNGLVLVTGPTGSGKSTTLAALIDAINANLRGHIVTLEDPIEYLFTHKSCIVNQREVGIDTGGFREALRYMLRQDPDVCLIGELRDVETIEAALTLAETGHLVFATLHTNSAVQTISRIVNIFPSGQQDRVRYQLSFVLNAVLSQRLIPALDQGMVVACELLFLNSSIRNLIRENKLHQVYGMMQVGQNRSHMQTLNQSLMSLLLRRRINIKEAFAVSPDPEELDSMMKKAGL